MVTSTDKQVWPRSSNQSILHQADWKNKEKPPEARLVEELDSSTHGIKQHGATFQYRKWTGFSFVLRNFVPGIVLNLHT